MLLSIIVPVYNVAQYLEQCISSLVNQSYQMLEILLIDDGSSDGSSMICDEWAQKDERIRVFHIENHGVSYARNIGLKHARGAYIGFVDSDDWIDLDMYDIMVKQLIVSQADICAGGYVHEFESRSTYPLKIEKEQTLLRDTALLQIFGSKQPKILGWGIWDKLFSRKVIEQLRFREDITHAEDMLFFWQAMKRVKILDYIPLFMYHYRMRVGSAVNNGISEKTLTAMIALEEMISSVAEENSTIKKVVEARYWEYTISGVRSMMILDPSRYKMDIIQTQKKIRISVLQILRNPHFNWRIRCGALYFCLPYLLCVSMRTMIRKKTDREYI
jgi:glycosyltransferase, family 2